MNDYDISTNDARKIFGQGNNRRVGQHVPDCYAISTSTQQDCVMVSAHFVRDGMNTLVHTIRSKTQNATQLQHRMRRHLAQPEYQICDNCGLPHYTHQVRDYGGGDVRCYIFAEYINDFEKYMEDGYVPF